MQRQIAEVGANHREMTLLLLLSWEVEGRDSDCPSGKKWAAEQSQAPETLFFLQTQPAWHFCSAQLPDIDNLLLDVSLEPALSGPPHSIQLAYSSIQNMWDHTFLV